MVKRRFACGPALSVASVPDARARRGRDRRPNRDEKSTANSGSAHARRQTALVTP